MLELLLPVCLAAAPIFPSKATLHTGGGKAEIPKREASRKRLRTRARELHFLLKRLDDMTASYARDESTSGYTSARDDLRRAVRDSADSLRTEFDRFWTLDNIIRLAQGVSAVADLAAGKGPAGFQMAVDESEPEEFSEPFRRLMDGARDGLAREETAHREALGRREAAHSRRITDAAAGALTGSLAALLLAYLTTRTAPAPPQPPPPQPPART